MKIQDLRRPVPARINENSAEILYALEDALKTAQSFTLPPNRFLYHGTDRDSFRPEKEELYPPAWFSMDAQTANDYAKWKRSGDQGTPRILEYRTTQSLKLLDATEPKISELFDIIIGNYTSEDLANAICELDYDGWYIGDVEIMLCLSGLDGIKYSKQSGAS